MTDTATAYIRRASGGGSGVPRPSSAPVEPVAANVASSTAETTVTVPLRRPLKPPEDKGTTKIKLNFRFWTSDKMNLLFVEKDLFTFNVKMCVCVFFFLTLQSKTKRMTAGTRKQRKPLFREEGGPRDAPPG